MKSTAWRVVFLMMAFTILFVNAAAGRTIVVDKSGSGSYTTIQAGINAASNGDTVKVFPGYYGEAVSVNKSIVLMGVGQPCEVLVAAPIGNTITVAAGSANAIIQGLTVEAPNGTGIYSQQYLTTYINNCVVRYCALVGIHYELYHSGGGTLRISNSILYQNTVYGICCYAGIHYLHNNVVLENGSCGVWVNTEHYGGSIVSDFNCVWGNGTDYGGNTYPHDSDINQPPLFVDPDNCDFHLQGGSPCIDAGKVGTSYNDCDGTHNDIGVYGGPSAYCGPGPVVTDLQLVPATVVKGETFTIQATGATR